MVYCWQRVGARFYRRIPVRDLHITYTMLLMSCDGNEWHNKIGWPSEAPRNLNTHTWTVKKDKDTGKEKAYCCRTTWTRTTNALRTLVRPMRTWMYLPDIKSDWCGCSGIFWRNYSWHIIQELRNIQKGCPPHGKILNVRYGLLETGVDSQATDVRQPSASWDPCRMPNTVSAVDW